MAIMEMTGPYGAHDPLKKQLHEIQRIPIKHKTG
jgi:hypothetical protein